MQPSPSWQEPLACAFFPCPHLQTASAVNAEQWQRRHLPCGRSFVHQWSRLECAQTHTMTIFLRANMAAPFVEVVEPEEGIKEKREGLLEGDDDEDCHRLKLAQRSEAPLLFECLIPGYMEE